MKRDQRVCTRTLGLFYVSQAGSHKTQAPKYKHVPTRNFTAFFCTKLQFHHPLQILWFLMNDNKQYQNFSLCQNFFKLLLDQIQRTISIITGMNIKVKSTQSHHITVPIKLRCIRHGMSVHHHQPPTAQSPWHNPSCA